MSWASSRPLSFECPLDAGEHGVGIDLVVDRVESKGDVETLFIVEIAPRRGLRSERWSVHVARASALAQSIASSEKS